MRTLHTFEEFLNEALNEAIYQSLQDLFDKLLLTYDIDSEDQSEVMSSGIMLAAGGGGASFGFRKDTVIVDTAKLSRKTGKSVSEVIKTLNEIYKKYYSHIINKRSNGDGDYFFSTK